MTSPDAAVPFFSSIMSPMRTHYIIKNLIIIAIISMMGACSQSRQQAIKENCALTPPQDLYGSLFQDILMNDSLFGTDRLFADSKDFLDCTPKRPMKEILSDYQAFTGKQEYNLMEQFIQDNFILATSETPVFADSSDINIHISKLWRALRRQADSQPYSGGTLIPLDYDYIVPGGRFREIYYWDSYFTMLGLFADNEDKIAENMIRNFASLIDKIGFIPNGNRTYYAGRSQPPFFSHMIEALANNKQSDHVYKTYLTQLQKEYDFWMKGHENLTANQQEALHCIRMKGGEILNRYYDRFDTPREEMYRNDMGTAEQLKNNQLHPDSKPLYRNLRSGAESGWDFSSRWLKDYNNLYSIRTIDIIPVDLNCLLYHLERTLAKAYLLTEKTIEAEKYAILSEKRKTAILKYCWNEQEKYFMDYDWRAQQPTNNFSLAGVYPLYVGIATNEQAHAVAAKVAKDFLKPGGVVTTLYQTGQQWDAPNGWAPLQWVTYKALQNYSQTEIADTLRLRWMNMVEAVYNNTHKLLEKYDVVNLQDTGGGEYPNQDGFGWTNGVYRAFAIQK